MNEPQSKPKQASNDSTETADKIFEELEKVPQIAEQESQDATVSELARQEEEAFAGTNSDSALIVQFAEQEEKVKNFKLQNEKLGLENNLLEHQNESLRLKNQSLKHKNEEEVILDNARRYYTKSLFILTASWLSVVVIFVAATGLRFVYLNNASCTENCTSFSLSENVIIAFITSTTATVIGIFIIVAKWLFPSPPKEEKTEEKKDEKK